MDDAHSFEEGIKKKERRKERDHFVTRGGGGGEEAKGHASRCREIQVLCATFAIAT